MYGADPEPLMSDQSVFSIITIHRWWIGVLADAATWPIGAPARAARSPEPVLATATAAATRLSTTAMTTAARRTGGSMSARRPAPRGHDVRMSLSRLAVVVIVVLAGCGAKPGPPLAAPAPARLPRAATSHVVVVVMENKERDDALDPSSAPYVSGLARRFGSMTASFGVRHPSLPNY